MITMAYTNSRSIFTVDYEFNLNCVIRRFMVVCVCVCFFLVLVYGVCFTLHVTELYKVIYSNGKCVYRQSLYVTITWHTETQSARNSEESEKTFDFASTTFRFIGVSGGGININRSIMLCVLCEHHIFKCLCMWYVCIRILQVELISYLFYACVYVWEFVSLHSFVSVFRISC